MFNFLNKFHWQIICAMIIGICLAYFFPSNKLIHEYSELSLQNVVKIEITYDESIATPENVNSILNDPNLAKNIDIVHNKNTNSYLFISKSKSFDNELLSKITNDIEADIQYYSSINEFNSYIYLLGDIFVKLLKMIIMPLIITSIIVGVTNARDTATIGRLGRKTFGYYLLTSMVAVITGLLLANLLRPGDSFSLEYFTSNDLENKKKTIQDLLMSFIMNPFEASANGKTLPSICFALLLGISITTLPDKLKTISISFFEAMYQAILKITTWIIRLAPIGVLGLMFKTINTSGFELLKSVILYAFTIAAGLSVHLFITLPIIFYMFTKYSPLLHFKAILPAMLTAFSTSSSSATLPVTMDCANKNIKSSKKVSGFVLPLGATVNMDGTALYECAGVLFISQIIGIDLSLSSQLIIVLTAFLASVGAAGVPSAGLVMIFIVLDAVGLSNNPQVPIIVGTMLAIDRPLDMLRTMVNVTSDTIGAAIIANSEGEKLYKD